MTNPIKFFVKILCVCAGACVPVFGLEAPYLISTTALSDSSVTVVWRNNDIAAQGFLIQRMDSTETEYHVIDTVDSATVTSIIDTQNLKPSTVYTYQVRAFQGTTVSDTSNHLQTTTLAAILKKSPVTLNWNCDTSKTVKLTIYDSSKCETGYRIYRNEDFSQNFTLVSQIVSSNPTATDSIIWFDSSVTSNKWYNYRVSAYTANDSLFLGPCSTYTYHDLQSQNVVKFTKVSEFPLSLSGWSAKAGDSIILKESNAPDGNYSIIDIKDPANPKFAGYTDSSALSSYPLNTLIPVYLKFGVSNGRAIYSNNRIYLVAFHKSLNGLVDSNRLKIYDNNFNQIDSFQMNNLASISHVNDSVICLLSITSSARIINHTYSFLKVSSTPLLFPKSFLYTVYYHTNAATDDKYPYIQGLTNGKELLISIDQSGYNSSGHLVTAHYIAVYDIFSNREIQLSGSSEFSGAINTGCFISSTERVCLHNATSTELFVSNIADSRGYQTAVQNNAVYSDSTIQRSAIQNVIPDTINKRVFVISNTKLTILSYGYSPAVGVLGRGDYSVNLGKGMRISNAPLSGVTITFPQGSAKSVDLCIFDLSGRMVDKITTVSSNSVCWKPAGRTTKCFVAVASIGKERYVSRFMVK